MSQENKLAFEEFADGLGELIWDEDVKPGDLYLAKGRGDIELLTCRKVGLGCIHPVEPGYSYDFSQCVKFVEHLER